jgi:hypothetical protein
MSKQINLITGEDEKLKCCNCRQEIEDGDERTCDGKIYCESCFSDLFGMCEYCEEYFPIDDLREGETRRHARHTGMFCERCWNNHFTDCADCGETVYVNDSCTNDEGRTICQDCSENYFYCESCGRTLSNDNYGGDERCEDCYREQEEENTNIHDYSYKPKPIFYGRLKDDDSFPFFGFELEIEGSKETADLISQDWLYCKHDGSLETGFEIVSHPLSFQWIKTNEDKLRGLLSKMRNAGMKSYNTTTCGIHWHVSKNQFSSLDIFKMLSFFYQNQKFILKISQRKIGALRQWAGFDSSLHVCVCKAKEKNNPRRYEAINLQNEHTIEFRIFRGTLHGDSFMKNIEFIHALCEFVKTAGLKDLTREKFIAFVATKKDYKNLDNFIQSHSI